METLGTRLKDLRISLNLTAKTVKEKISIDDLGRYEKDERKPSIDTLLAIANFYNVSIDWLLTGEGEMKKNNNIEFNEDEYETVIVSPEQNELWEYYKRLNKIDQAKILERIKATVEIKEEIKKEIEKKHTTKSKKEKRKINVRKPIIEETKIGKANVS